MPKHIEQRPSATRSFNMSRIRYKDTRAELLLRRAMWHQNIRYRVHSSKVPGKPDILIKKYRLAIFVDGGFWHGYRWETNKHKIKSNINFWINKIERNIQRDLEVNNLLSEQGFTVMRFWDHQVIKELHKCLNQIQLFIEIGKLGGIPEKE